MSTMTIQHNIKISEVQKEFNVEFPFLKLEFYKRLHEVHNGNSKKNLLDSNMKLTAVNGFTHEPFVIHENMQVSKLEDLFKERFEISAQVFRKSGRSWLETSLTDDWTLKRQNDEGRELSYFT
jgi:hypothetical protein